MREEQRNLIRRVAARETGAAEEFIAQWDQRFHLWIRSQVPPEKVEEYAQEVWVHFMQGNWLRLLQWDGLYNDEAWHPRSLEGFLHRVVRNKVTDLWRSEAPKLPDELDPADIIDRTTRLGNDPLVEAERSRLLRAYDFCTRAFRRIDHLQLRLWWEGFSGEEIAEATGINANNVYQRRSYLFRRLRRCLVERLPEYFRDD